MENDETKARSPTKTNAENRWVESIFPNNVEVMVLFEISRNPELSTVWKRQFSGSAIEWILNSFGSIRLLELIQD